jgi:acyl-CoA reductase-like NAD-dependent aldehyde dehydrogenase
LAGKKIKKTNIFFRIYKRQQQKMSSIAARSPPHNIFKSLYPFYVNNKPVFTGESDPKLAVFDKVLTQADQHSPTAKPVTRVCIAHADHISQAIEGAQKAKQAMRKLGSYERRAILEHVVSSVRNKSEEFAQALVYEAGKPIRDSRVEI